MGFKAEPEYYLFESKIGGYTLKGVRFTPEEMKVIKKFLKIIE